MHHLLDQIIPLLPYVGGLIGYGIGFYWIHRIAKDIENN